MEESERERERAGYRKKKRGGEGLEENETKRGNEKDYWWRYGSEEGCEWSEKEIEGVKRIVGGDRQVENALKRMRDRWE